jgi:hypothetical protein
VLRTLCPSRLTVLAVAFAVLSSSAALAQEDGEDEADAPPETEAPAALEPPANRALLDGEVRRGAFLAGPGSLTFVLHHTLMGAAGGFVTQGIAANFSVDDLGTRQRMLAGTLIGAGLGFGVSAWWQFNNWIDHPMANFGIVNSVLTGLLMVGVMDLITNNPLTLSWTAVVGTQVGAWLTATLAGGKMPLNQGLLVSSGGLWGTIYSGLLLAILASTGTKIRAERAFDVMAVSAGLGGVALAMASARFSPTSAQVLRASAFGLGVGAAVWVVSFLVVGLNPNVATPHVLALVSSAAAIATVSLLWEEAAERPEDKRLGAVGNAKHFYRSPERDRPYATVWW